MQNVLNNNIYENCVGATMRSILPIVESKENLMIFLCFGDEREMAYLRDVIEARGVARAVKPLGFYDFCNLHVLYTIIYHYDIMFLKFIKGGEGQILNLNEYDKYF